MKSSPEPAIRASERGLVFDIRRFSTHDGDGVRTTVFLKGCPLRCLWCHNPEGLVFGRRPLWVRARCIGCGSCVQHARHGGVAPGADGLALRPDAPEDWDDVFDACPTGALRWDAREMSVGEAVEEVLRDRVFFQHGGGATLSGGEPLLQPAFAAALLEALRAEGVHTALETSLYAAWEQAESVLAQTDLVYCDLKLVSDGEHRRLTGVSNAPILANIRRLLAAGRRVIVRTPLIPGMTATAENIAGIARFLHACRPDVEYELLNYNPLAPAKYPLVGMTFAPGEDIRPFSEDEMEAFLRIARENGLAAAFRER